MTIDQIFNTNEKTGGESLGLVSLDDRKQMVKNELLDFAQRIANKSNELTGRNIIEKRDVPSVMFDLEIYMWEELEKLSGG